MGSIIIFDVVIAILALSFMGIKDCEGSRESGVVASSWSLITSACIIAIGYDSWWSVLLVALAFLGGLLMLFNVNALKITYHAISM